MQYDGLDRLTRYAMNGRDWRYWYSNEQRLDTVTNPQGATQVALGYDTRGNVLSRTRGAGWVSFGYDRGDRAITVSENNALLATHRYDGLGRRTKTTKANGDQRFQIYTQGGQFVWEGDFVSSQGVASGVNYVNLNGSLIAKLVADWNLPAQRSSDGRTPKVGGVFRNVFADAGATAIVAPADGSKPQRLADVPVTYHLRYVHTDALGSPVLETNAEGYEIAGTRTFYEPYGAPLTTPREGAPSYTGHQYDTSTGMLYAQQRYYDPQLGVFMSPDPMAVDTTSAFNFNRYAYANNSPYKFTDPDGRFGIVAVWPVVVVAAIVGGAAYVATHPIGNSTSGQSDGLSGLLGQSDTLPIFAERLNEATRPEGQASYPANPDDWAVPEGWRETNTGSKTDGKHRQWVDSEGRLRRRWDREGREAGKERGPHWHDLDDESGGKKHIEPDDAPAPDAPSIPDTPEEPSRIRPERSE